MIKEKIQGMIAALEAALVDAEKFEGVKMNSAAGTRVRNVMQQIKVQAQEVRKDVTDKKNSVKAEQ